MTATSEIDNVFADANFSPRIFSIALAEIEWSIGSVQKLHKQTYGTKTLNLNENAYHQHG